jgi:hypothetical protein
MDLALRFVLNQLESMKTTQKKNRKWLQSKDQRKTPKVFMAQFMQNRDGSFSLLPGQSAVQLKINQCLSEWVEVNTKDLAAEMAENGIQ